MKIPDRYKDNAPTLMEKALLSPSMLTPSQRTSARYRTKVMIKTRINFLNMVLNSNDKKMRKFLVSALAESEIGRPELLRELAAATGTGIADIKDAHDAGDARDSDPDDDPETRSIEDAYWSGAVDL